MVINCWGLGGCVGKVVVVIDAATLSDVQEEVGDWVRGGKVVVVNFKP